MIITEDELGITAATLSIIYHREGRTVPIIPVFGSIRLIVPKKLERTSTAPHN